MKVSGSYSLPVGPERAYRLLQDPGELARAMPGCESLEQIGPDEYRLRLKVILATLTGSFEGSVRIADPTPPLSFRLMVEGSGRIGFLKGQGVLHLAAAHPSTEVEGTEVSYDGEVEVGGTLAAVGQRLVDGASKMMIKRFFEKLSQNVRESRASLP
ncbi:MAG TPA: carbon monoxide dehydrogenase subunit G [Candidatus Cybelea sp.]|nr:carbon monoxide dehydrogenase subunit G [Candidatus Cybelea sp.]